MQNKNLAQLQYEWTHELPQLFGVDNFHFKIAYPLTYDPGNMIEETFKQINGLREVHQYRNTPSASKSLYFNFPLATPLCEALKNDCPLAYALLAGEIIKLLKSSQELPSQEQMQSIETILAQSVVLFGAPGHFFSLRVNLELGHCCKRDEATFSPLFFQERHKKAQEYYEKALNAYHLFNENKDAHEGLFINAHFGMSIDEIIQIQLHCKNSQELLSLLEQLYFSPDRAIVSNNVPRW